MGAAETTRIFAALGLDASTATGDAGDLVILRHALMNPYLIDRENGISYIERYFEFLEAGCASLPDAAVTAASATPEAGGGGPPGAVTPVAAAQESARSADTHLLQLDAARPSPASTST